MLDRFEEFSAGISSIYKYMQKIERDEMAKYGLKGPHVQCLLALHRTEEGLTAARLCELCGKDKAAISRTVSEMESAGLLFREGTSYRALLRLTAQGQRTAAEIGGIVSRAVELAGRGLTDQDRQVFYTTLNRIAENLRTLSADGLP